MVGVDTDKTHVEALAGAFDRNGEVSVASLADSAARFTTSLSDLAGTSTFIIAVPTPITDVRRPDLGPIRTAFKTTGPYLRNEALVILVSTFCPGVTEEIYGNELTAAGGLDACVNFALGYSPERVNPGDAKHSLENVVKIVAGQDEDTLDRVERIYAPVVNTGLHHAPSIKTARPQKSSKTANAV